MSNTLENTMIASGKGHSTAQDHVQQQPCVDSQLTDTGCSHIHGKRIFALPIRWVLSPPLCFFSRRAAKEPPSTPSVRVAVASNARHEAELQVQAWTGPASGPARILRYWGLCGTLRVPPPNSHSLQHQPAAEGAQCQSGRRLLCVGSPHCPRSCRCPSQRQERPCLC